MRQAQIEVCAPIQGLPAVARFVRHYAKQPGPKWPGCVEPIERSISFDKSLLRSVSRVVGVAGEHDSHAEGNILVAFDDLIERLVVAIPGPRY